MDAIAFIQQADNYNNFSTTPAKLSQNIIHHILGHVRIYPCTYISILMWIRVKNRENHSTQLLHLY